MPAFVLSFHATYGCRERGACCTAGWPIPIERENLELIEQARRGGHFQPSTTAAIWFERAADGLAEAPAILAVHDGACVFHGKTGPGRCELHRGLGHAALPLACRQFPRVSVHDPRGTSITLSHYCPTAAELLDEAGPIEIAADGPGFPWDGEYVGLDARESLPPLLRPGMLMDWESWWAFEREAIALVNASSAAEEALARLDHAVEQSRTWRPSDGPLERHVSGAFATARSLMPSRSGHRLNDAASFVRESMPPEFRPVVPLDRAPAPSPQARIRYVAAHAFANWTAHLGQGLRTWLRSIEAADALVDQGMDVSQADLWLRHLVDPKALAERLQETGSP